MEAASVARHYEVGVGIALVVIGVGGGGGWSGFEHTLITAAAAATNRIHRAHRRVRFALARQARRRCRGVEEAFGKGAWEAGGGGDLVVDYFQGHYLVVEQDGIG